MKCTPAERLMSAYYDRELPPNLRSEMGRHLKTCGNCSQLLAGFRRLSQLASQLSDPTPPTELWDRIQCLMRSPANRSPERTFGRVLARGRTASRMRPAVRVAVVAATVLLAVTGLLLVMRVGLHNAEQRRIATDFDHYFSQFDHDPDSAQRILTDSYDGRRVSLHEAATLVRYEPAAARHVPAGYSLHDVSVLKMPCCTCVQVIWKRLEGGYLTVFEHDREQTFWFGDRPAISVRCDGTTLRIAQLDQMIAATWASRTRQLTLVGPRDLDELLRLVSHFEDKS